MGSDAQCTTTIEQHDDGDESNSRFQEQTWNNQLQHRGTQHKETKAQSTIDIWIEKYENTLTITLTEKHLNEKILDSEIQMKNFIGFRADRTYKVEKTGV